MVSPSRPSDAEDREIFLAAVGEVRPLRDRERAPAPRPGRRPAPPAPRPATPELAIERDGDRLSARAPGVSRRQLADLRAGRRGREATLDLHRHTTEQARRELARFLEASAEAGRRSVLVITGKGRHSEAGPVLRDAVAEWMAGPLAARVQAFTTAPDREGGDGAYCVLLRKP